MTAFHIPDIVITRARALAAADPDPVAAFLYDLDALEDHAATMRGALPDGVELFYAVKANSEPAILDALARHVDGFEISSGGEIARIAACAIRRPFVFSGPGKLASELTAARAAGVEAVHVESFAEIDRLAALIVDGPPQAVLIRVNPLLPSGITSRLAMAGGATPFGIDEAQLPTAVARVEAAAGLRLVGFHVHALSHQHDVDRHARLLAHYLDRWPFWRSLAARPADIRELNVGGGIGVDYAGPTRFDWPGLCHRLGDLLADRAAAPRLRFEIGRFLTAYCGYYAIQIIELKENHGRRFAVCRGGTHQFRLPAAQGHDHPIVHLPLDGRPAAGGIARSVAVVGQLCTPKDVLSRNAPLVDPRAGDLLILPLAGAYGYNISHADFLCHPRPRQIFVRQGKAACPRSQDHAEQPERLSAQSPGCA